jgi:protein involved in polysaccharide export with SLBB domain
MRKKMKNLSKVLLPSIIYFLVVPAYTQDLSILENLEGILENVDASSSSISLGGDQENFSSLTKNEYSNVVSQLQSVSDSSEDEEVLSELKKARLDLATKLCKKDPRACFLIDEYHQFSMQNFDQEYDADILFGTDLFGGFPLSTSLVEDIPLNDEYIIKSGDYLGVMIISDTTKDELIQVKQDGKLNIPQVGSVSVAGQTLGEAKKNLQKIVSTKYIGAEITLYLEQIRANRVFALGSVKFPNAYTINAQGSLINLMIAAGGFKQNSSLRNLKVVRKNSDPEIVDLYNLLINGDSREDYNLKSGDVVVVTGASDIVKISGEVNRPGRYEFKKGETVKDLLFFAQDFSSYADQSSVTLQRLNKLGQYEILNVEDFSMQLKAGDVLEVRASQGEIINQINILGAVRSPGKRAFQENMTLGSIVDINSDLIEKTYTAFGLIERQDRLTRSSTLINFDLMDQNSLNKVLLKSNDRVYFFSHDDVSFLHSNILEAHLNQSLFSSISKENLNSEFKNLYNQSNSPKFKNLESVNLANNITQLQCLTLVNSYGGSQNNIKFKSKISIFESKNSDICPELLNNYPQLTPVLLSAAIPVYGSVRNPGLYPASKMVKASAALKLAGGIINSNKEVSYQVESLNDAQPKITRELDEDKNNLKSLNIVLENSQDDIGFVNLVGEFKYPGKYPINSKTTLLDILERAGGYTANAYPEGGIFTRDAILEREIIALERSKKELANILSNAAATGIVKQSSNDILGLYQLMSTIAEAKPSGRIVTELEIRRINNNLQYNIMLEPGDSILIPKRPSSVSVVGAVLNPVTVPYVPSYSIKDYIEFSGGYQTTADKRLAYFILPNGKSVNPSGNFSFMGSEDILPGSTIIVPRKARPLQGLALVEVITPILANLSITAASISAISNN